MLRLALACALSATVCLAQLPLSPTQVPPSGNGTQTVPSSVRDRQEWIGPLALYAGDPRFYRTFGMGFLPDSPIGANIDPSAVLVGFEISTLQGTLCFIQPYYLNGGRRMMGAPVGVPRGSRSQILARDGYAVREVRFSAADSLEGFHVLFARIQPNGTLSDTDLLSSDPQGRSVSALHAGGLPFCGIATAGVRSVEGLALLVSQPLVQSLKPALTPVSRGPKSVSGLTSVFTPGALTSGSAQPPAPPTNSLPPGVIPLNPGASEMVVPTIATPASPLASVDPGLIGARMGELLRTTGESLIFVEGGDGQGSGFLCTVNGKRLLLTNQHVIRGNPGVRFTTLNQSVVKAGVARAAVGHDIIAYEIADALPALEASTDFAQAVAVGDDVAVLGNTEGARVVKPLHGRVVGIGPNLVEVSSEFLPGNSGSPIIHLKTGKVIGIATYAIIRDVNALTGQKEASVRRFGYRMDSVQNWQPVNWPIYQAEAAAAKKVGDFSGAIINLLMDLRSRQFSSSKHTDSRLKPALNCLTNLNRSGTTMVDRLQMVKNFLGEIRNATQRDVNDLRPRLRYDYFQRELEEEGKFRAEIYKGLGEAMQTLR